MTQFDLSLWLQDKSRKVVTRNGRSVRILDYNLKGDKRICIAVNDKTQESITTVDEEGHCLRDGLGWHESPFDLFFADEEEELTEFEKEYKNLYTEGYADGQAGSKPLSDKVLKECAIDLLDLARKELQPEFDKELDKAYKSRDEVVYLQGYDRGKQDALKDLPKWKKAHEHKEFPLHVCVMDENMYPILDTEVNEDEYYIELEDLKTLSKEE